MGFTPAENIINGIRKQLGLDEKIFAVFAIWERELGPLAKYLKIAGIKKGQLIVEAETNVHLQEAMFKRRDLIKKINQHFGGEKVVKSIRVKLKD